MTFWGRVVVPHMANKLLAAKAVREARERVLPGLHGDVVEIGFGSGLNVPLYPPTVTKVWAVEPSDVGFGLAKDRLAASSVPVERAGLDGQSLPFEDARFDSALSTWTMCTIPDLDRALAELRRVLKPGGRLHFLEHGLAPDEGVQRWQRRLEPINRRIAGGCHLTRDAAAHLRAAGFELERLDQKYAPGDPKPWGYTYEGVAVSPG